MTVETAAFTSEGEPFTLTCVADVVAGLVQLPTIAWSSSDGTVVENGTGTRLNMTFPSSDTGPYTCEVLISIPAQSEVKAMNTIAITLDNIGMFFAYMYIASRSLNYIHTYVLVQASILSLAARMLG